MSKRASSRKRPSPNRQRSPSGRPFLSPPPIASNNNKCDLFRSIFGRVTQLSSGCLQLVDRPLDGKQCLQLVSVLQAHTFNLNPDFQEEVHSSLGLITEGNSHQAVLELTCAYLYQIERRLDTTNQVMDIALAQLMSPVAAPSVADYHLSCWIGQLQANLHALSIARLGLQDITGRFPLPAIYHTEHNTILLHAHLQATFTNLGTVMGDAEQMLLALGWYQNAMHFNGT